MADWLFNYLDRGGEVQLSHMPQGGMAGPARQLHLTVSSGLMKLLQECCLQDSRLPVENTSGKTWLVNLLLKQETLWAL